MFCSHSKTETETYSPWETVPGQQMQCQMPCLAFRPGTPVLSPGQGGRRGAHGNLVPGQLGVRYGGRCQA
jgi:hypothetical protein